MTKKKGTVPHSSAMDLNARHYLVRRTMRTIDADKLILHLANWALTEAPDERSDNEVKKYTEHDLKHAIWETIHWAIQAVEDADTVAYPKALDEIYVEIVSNVDDEDMFSLGELKTIKRVMDVMKGE